MSVLTDAKTTILKRLTELEPARREYDELLEAAKDLKLDYDADAAANGRPSAPSRPARTRGRSGSKARGRAAGSRRIAPAGQRRQQVLDLVNAAPDGITVAQAAEKLGLKDATSLFRIQKQLVSEGAVRKDGAQMFPVAPPAS